jgi:hypothetical protein
MYQYPQVQVREKDFMKEKILLLIKRVVAREVPQVLNEGLLLCIQFVIMKN